MYIYILLYIIYIIYYFKKKKKSIEYIEQFIYLPRINLELDDHLGMFSGRLAQAE